MFRTQFFVFIILIAVFLASCAPEAVTPIPPPTMTEEPAIPVTGVAVVQGVEIQILGSQPLQVNVIVRGQLPDGGCTTISAVNQVRDGNTFKITLATTTDPLAICAQALTPFEEVVPLDVSTLPPATYFVNANGIEQSFDLVPQDVSQFKQVLVDGLNARNYDLLKILMDQSLTIGYWLSEGTTISPDAAIEQFSLNLLNSTSPIVADPSKNLIELLGTDWEKIVDPEIKEVNPLFTSGWGSQGKDEAILFVAKLPDGSLYWYGMLFARDGFKQGAPTTGVNQPAPGRQPIPTISILEVVKDGSVTIRTNNYPANIDFKVRMNVMGTQGVNGFVVDTINSRKGGSFTATFDIPPKLHGEKKIAIRLESKEGYYSYNWFENSNSGNVSNPQPTDVKYVIAQQDVTVYSGPGNNYRNLGRIAEGQIVKVTGISADGNWWQVICPDGTAGSCWVSANTRFTRPVDINGTADVQSLEIRILESYPLQVNAIARGQLPDAGCTTITSASQQRSGNVIRVTLKTTIDPLALCAQMLTPFEYVIPLDVSHLLPGTYIVNVNGVEGSFELPEYVDAVDVP